MIIGTLNTRCRIEYKVTTRDDTYNSEIVTWALLAVVWCNLQDELPSKSEALKQGLVLNVNSTRWRARYRSDVDSSMRIVVMRPQQRTYQIASGPAEIGNKDGLECMLEEYSSKGA